ncbi:MAG: response regulator transcription factor [Actinobacteria bacterium]|nr:MAG: response regulator transcription factor [Actinomycetota bacterium]
MPHNLDWMCQSNKQIRVFSWGKFLKVLIVNQNALVSQAMRAILESHDFEVSLSAYALQARAEQPGIPAPGRPDVALVDIRVPDSGGIEAGRRIIRDHPMAKVLALTAQEDAGVLTAASQAGFHGWVLKDAALLAQHLTRREREVLGLLVEGESSQSISFSLSLSPHTVRTHIQNILTKLQVHSRFEAVSFALRFDMTLEPSRLGVGKGGGEGAA